ncbi:hypothetical protein ACWGJ2_24615 [Streptomyces sp. NPDC054796]
MTHRIGPALKRTLAHILAVLAPRARPLPAAHTPRTLSGRRLLTRVVEPPHLPVSARGHRDAPAFDGAAGPLVRPYFLAHERQERRTALALALDGIDVGPWVIHGHPVGAPAVAGVAA